MPIASPIDIAVLSSPIPLPKETGTIAPSSFGTGTQQNIQAITRGSGVTSPIGTGNTMAPMPYSPVGIPGQLEGGSTVTGAALESGGSNVGGVVQQAPKEDLETKLEFASLEDQKIAAAEKAQEEQVSEYMKAFEEGAVSERDTRAEQAASGAATGAAIGTFTALPGVGTALGSAIGGTIGFLSGRKKGEEIKPGMRAARYIKRQDRREDRKARREAGLKGSQKRAMRKAQRKSRRAAFKDFKAERDYQASLDAAQL